MKLHDIEVTPRGVRIDGVPVFVEASGPRVETRYPDLHIVHLPVFAQSVTLNADSHDPDVGTPIYDELLTEVQA